MKLLIDVDAAVSDSALPRLSTTALGLWLRSLLRCAHSGQTHVTEAWAKAENPEGTATTELVEAALWQWVSDGWEPAVDGRLVTDSRRQGARGGRRSVASRRERTGTAQPGYPQSYPQAPEAASGVSPEAASESAPEAASGRVRTKPRKGSRAVPEAASKRLREMPPKRVRRAPEAASGEQGDLGLSTGLSTGCGQRDEHGIPLTAEGEHHWARHFAECCAAVGYDPGDADRTWPARIAKTARNAGAPPAVIAEAIRRLAERHATPGLLPRLIADIVAGRNGHKTAREEPVVRENPVDARLKRVLNGEARRDFRGSLGYEDRT